MTTVTVIETSNKAIETINAIKAKVANSPTGVSFFGIKGYTNKDGETSNYTINIGVSYESCKAKDIETLKNADLTAGNYKSDIATLEEARTKLINNLLTPNKAQSEAQTEAYETIAPNVKRHLTNNMLYISGYRVNKKVLVPGNYADKKPVKSAAITIAQNELKKVLKLRTAQYRTFTLDAYDLNFELMATGEVDIKIYGEAE